jgi:RNA polymerase sigma-70 factor (ECF subfamily)
MSIPEFNSQLEKHSHTLHSFAYNLTRDIEDAKDLIQETMYRALLNCEKFRMGTNLKAWLYTIMKNIFINNYRRGAKIKSVADESENAFHLNSLACSTGNSGETQLALAEIDKAIGDLVESIRIPFLLFYQGYKYDEIAAYLHIPLGTVKSRIFFARRELQQRIRR